MLLNAIIKQYVYRRCLSLVHYLNWIPPLKINNTVEKKINIGSTNFFSVIVMNKVAVKMFNVF